MLGERNEINQRLDEGSRSSKSSDIVTASMDTSAALMLFLRVSDGGEESDPTLGT